MRRVVEEGHFVGESISFQAHQMNPSLAHSISHTEVYTMSPTEAHSMFPTHEEIIILRVLGKFLSSL